MKYKQLRTAASTNIGAGAWQKAVLILLAVSFCVALGSGCRKDDEPAGSMETSVATEEVIPTETEPPAEPETSTEHTEESQPDQTTSPTEMTAPPTESTMPPTENTEPTEETTRPTETTEPTQPSVPETELPLQIEAVPNGSQVLLIPDRAWGFAKRDLTKPVEDAIYSYKFINERLDLSVPVTLSVQITNIPQGLAVTSITITLADNADFADGRMFRLTGDQRSVNVPFLLVNTQYYYQVSVVFNDVARHILEANFRTAASPRLLSIDGIVNVRDIGGWKTTDGYVIRQGLLYRGGELDGAVRPEYKLTAEGLRQMRQELGIRTDMDLRHPGELQNTVSPLGEDVPLLVYGAPGYEETFLDSGRDAIRKIFADLADESKYPVYLHCTYGVDRTGTVCYLLEALLGVSEADLQREYELSTMYHTWVNSPGLQRLIAALKTWEGETLQENTEAFLLDCGVTPEQIAQIRDIFLEKQ